MGKRTTAMGSRSTLSRYLSQNRITGTVKQIAVTHEINRQSVVKEILVHVFLMSKFKLLSGAVMARKAESQYLSGSNNEQAAHCAPGQLRANGQRIQDLVIASDDLHVMVDNLFGATDIMDANFNKADSSAEDSGLRMAFENACNIVAQIGATARFGRAYEFHHFIDNAFSRYKSEGTQAFRVAIVRQQNEMRSKTGADLVSRQERVFITETYLTELSTAPISLETVMGLDTEDLWRAYR